MTRGKKKWYIKHEEPKYEEITEVTTSKNNTLREGETYDIKPKYLSNRHPAKCKDIIFRYEPINEVYMLQAHFYFTEEARESIRGKFRRVRGYDIDYTVFNDTSKK